MILLQRFLLFETINCDNDYSLYSNITKCDSISYCVLHHFAWLRLVGTKNQEEKDGLDLRTSWDIELFPAYNRASLQLAWGWPQLPWFKLPLGP